MTEKDFQLLELMADVFVKQNGIKVSGATLELIYKIQNMAKMLETLQSEAKEEKKVAAYGKAKPKSKGKVVKPKKG